MKLSVIQYHDLQYNRIVISWLGTKYKTVTIITLAMYQKEFAEKLHLVSRV